MSWAETLRRRLTGPRISDHDIELLLTGSPTGSDGLGGLEGFIGSLPRDIDPPHDPGTMATALAATARATRRSPRRAVHRMVAFAASLAVLFAFSGMAIASDDAVPGDFLYRLDLALELVGIGDGGVDERMIEFDALLSRGQNEKAFELLDQFAESAPEADSAEAQLHIDFAANKSNVVAAEERVTAKKSFIEENKGDSVGVDGRDFGQRVAIQAQSDPNRGGPDRQSDTGSGNAVSQEPPERGPDGPGTPADSEQGSTTPDQDKDQDSDSDDPVDNGNGSREASGKGPAHSDK